MEGSRNTVVERSLPPTRGKAPHPALVVLHGRGANELDLLQIGPAIDPGLYTIALRAPITLGPDSYEWYDLRDPSSMVGQMRQSVDGVITRLETLDQDYPIDPTRVILAGFSQGGAITVGTILRRPDLLRAAAVLSGYFPFSVSHVSASRALPIFQAHGVLDEVIPVSVGKATSEFLRSSGNSVTYRQYPIGHTISAAELGDVTTWLGGLDLGLISSRMDFT